MSSLERYKKKGGFLQLLSLVESSEPAKAERFLQLIQQEGEPWVAMILKKRLTLEKVSRLPERVISEALEVLPANVLAVAYWKEPEEVRQQVFQKLSPVLKKKIENAFRDIHDPRPGDIISCQIRIFQSVRQTLHNGSIPQNLIPEDLRIPNDIEDQLTLATLSQKLKTNASSRSSVTNSSTPSLGKTGAADERGDYEKENRELKMRLSVLEQENEHLKKIISELNQKLALIKKATGS
ncbi:MAG: hypothetical protein NZ480_06865 [Bdellovibrionaceae bacterium]|nr:hypothetical protein [Pseudobdellovibrionaceae bacterium]MDW8190309.1 FliG C-terminal domain-containing protein [Pseudobdellovibrionaceae bacterium]